MKKRFAMVAVSVLATALMFGVASAAVTFDALSGTGFVGKGDVQMALGLNNAQLQALGNPTFAVTVSEVTTWRCQNTNNETIVARSVTTATHAVVSSVARERNQITGFSLEGYSSSGAPVVDGPALFSCPGDNGNPNSDAKWELVDGSQSTGDPVSSVSVNGVPLQ